MAELTKRLKLYSNSKGTTEFAKIYSSTSDLISGKPYMPVYVDGIGNGYVQLDSVGAANGTNGRVCKNSTGLTYQICSQAKLESSYISYSTTIRKIQTTQFTVPAGVKVILLYTEDEDSLFDSMYYVQSSNRDWGGVGFNFIGVTPGETYSLEWGATYMAILWSASINSVDSLLTADNSIKELNGIVFDDLKLDKSSVLEDLTSMLNSDPYFDDGLGIIDKQGD